MQRKAFWLLLLLTGSIQAFAQPLSAYVNLQNQLMAWDNGFVRKIDYLQPRDYKVGRSAIPYIDNASSFKIYFRGAVSTVNSGFTSEFRVSDNLVSFLNASSLNVFDNGTIKNLTTVCPDYLLGDSLVYFIDGIKNEYKVYYKGKISTIENFLAASAVDTVMSSGNTVKVSDNVLAYVNYANQFRIFYHGVLINQEEYLINGFGVGRNTVAYIDANREFKVFQNGRTRVLEDYPPQNYSVGDNMVSYVSTDGYFKIFYNDSLYKIGFFVPSRWETADNLVVYQDPTGYSKVFYHGEITPLESYFPDALRIQYNSLAYISRANVLRLFTEGELYDVTSADIDRSSWGLTYDVLRYQIGQSIFKIYYKGQEY